MHEILPSPPLAQTLPTSFEQHGQRFVDPYAWLQDKHDPAVIAHLEAENAYAAELLRHTLPLQEQIFQEMRGRIQEDDASAPQRHGDFFYYTRVEAGKQYRLICRRRSTPDAAEEVLLDENALAAGNAYCNIFRVIPSPDHTLLAYTLDTTGALVYDLFVIDAASGALLCGPIANVAWSLAWSADGGTLFYTTFDAAHRAYRLYRHRLGDDPAQAALVYQEPDDAFSINVHCTRSGAFLLLTSASHTSSEVRFLAADQPEGEFRLIHPRQPWHEYYVDHHGERFLIRSDENAENFKLLEAPVSAPHKEHWRELIPHRADTLLEDVDLFRNHLVLYERRAGLPVIRICSPDGLTTLRSVDFPEPVYTISTSLRGNPLAVNPEFSASTLRFFYSSLVTPNSTVDIGLSDDSWTVRKQQAIASGYDPAQYASQRLYAPAVDGASVPISLVYRKDARRVGGNPLLLKGYGAYGYSAEPAFDANLLSLLDRGFVYAIAHIRGGSELGRSWYEQGRLLHKKNSFTDFIACADHLIAEGWSTPALLTMRGRSAGGLLMSAVANMRPDLARAMVAEVAFANVITAMLSPELPLTVSEYEQWGNPADPEAFAYMLSYSPYDNVEAKAYPHIYATAGLNDLQVPYWDPAKWVARLRATKTDHNRLLLITNMAAGHGGASGRYDSLREEARVYAFLIDTLGA